MAGVAVGLSGARIASRSGQPDPADVRCNDQNPISLSRSNATRQHQTHAPATSRQAEREQDPDRALRVGFDRLSLSGLGNGQKWEWAQQHTVRSRRHCRRLYLWRELAQQKSRRLCAGRGPTRPRLPHRTLMTGEGWVRPLPSQGRRVMGHDWTHKTPVHRTVPAIRPIPTTYPKRTIIPRSASPTGTSDTNTTAT